MEDDACPQTQNDLGLEFNQGSPSFGTKIQEIVLALQGSKSEKSIQNSKFMTHK